jgi:hypothetical protein
VNTYWKVEVQAGRRWKYFFGINSPDIHGALDRAEKSKFLKDPADWRVRPSTKQEIDRLDAEKVKQ